MTTGGGAGFGQGGAAPSVTTLAPRLAGVRLALAGDRAKQALGAALVLLWAAWLVALWVTQPRLVTTDRLDADLAEGRVTAYAVVSLNDPSSGGGGSGVFIETPGPQVFPARGVGLDRLLDDEFEGWSSSTRLSVAYWVDSPVAGLRVLNPDRTSPGELARAAQRLEEAGAQDRTNSVSYDSFADPAGTRYPLLMVVGLVLVIVGPRPERGNRWFWFWLMGLPLGLGLLAFAVLELLRPIRMPVPRRWSGWAGFGLSILGAIPVTIVFDQLAGLAPLLLVRP